MKNYRCLDIRTTVTVSILLLSLFFSGISILSPVYAEETNLIRNGDFSDGLDHWIVLPYKEVGNAPSWGVSEVFPGNPSLVLDTPTGSAAYAYQEFSLPVANKSMLSFKVFGTHDPVDLTIWLGHIETPYVVQDELLDEFDPMGKLSFGGVPTYKTYDLNTTRYGGTDVVLMFFSTSPFTWSPAVGIDDIRVTATYDENSVITCNAQSNSTSLAQVALEQTVIVSGSVFPSRASNVTLTFLPPVGFPFVRNIVSNVSGEYRYEFEPGITGVWKVNASCWGGGYNNATSCYSQFLVSTHSSIDASRCVMNGVEVDPRQPNIEALPGEKLTGFFELESIEPGRHANMPVVAISSIEKGRWDLLTFHMGIVKDYFHTNFSKSPKLELFGYKIIVTPPLLVTYRSPGPQSGAFEYSFRWEFPVSQHVPNDLFAGELMVVASHPTYTAPQEENVTFYIALIQDATFQAKDIVFPSNGPISEILNKTIDSIWDLNNTDWERFALGSRNETNRLYTNILSIPIKVVADPGPLIQQAGEMISEVNRNIAEFPDYRQELLNAKRALSDAEDAFSSRRFSMANQNGTEARNLANGTLVKMKNDTESHLFLAEQLTDQLDSDWGNWIDFSDIDSLIGRIRSEFNSGNFAEASKLIRSFYERVGEYTLPITHPANKVIDKLRSNRWGFPELGVEIHDAEDKLYESEAKFIFGNFSRSRELASEAHVLANITLTKMENITHNEIRNANETMVDLRSNWKGYFDLSDLDDFIDKAWDEFRAGDFAKARQSLEDFKEEIERYVLPPTHQTFEKLSKLKDNLWGFPDLKSNVTEVETLLSDAQGEFTKGGFTRARELTNQSLNQALAILEKMRGLADEELNDAESAFIQTKFWWRWLLNLFEVKRTITTAKKEFSADNYARTISLTKEFDEKNTLLWISTLLLIIFTALAYLVSGAYLRLISASEHAQHTRAYILRVIFALGIGSVISLAFQSITLTWQLAVLVVSPYVSMPFLIRREEKRHVQVLMRKEPHK